MELNSNPKCPECGSTTQKMGCVATRKGKRVRYRCSECGVTFSRKA